MIIVKIVNLQMKYKADKKFLFVENKNIQSPEKQKFTFLKQQKQHSYFIALSKKIVTSKNKYFPANNKHTIYTNKQINGRTEKIRLVDFNRKLS